MFITATVKPEIASFTSHSFQLYSDNHLMEGIKLVQASFGLHSNLMERSWEEKRTQINKKNI